MERILGRPSSSFVNLPLPRAHASSKIVAEKVTNGSPVGSSMSADRVTVISPPNSVVLRHVVHPGQGLSLGGSGDDGDGGG